VSRLTYGDEPLLPRARERHIRDRAAVARQHAREMGAANEVRPGRPSQGTRLLWQQIRAYIANGLTDARICEILGVTAMDIARAVTAGKREEGRGDGSDGA